jgi:hypothetical protein
MPAFLSWDRCRETVGISDPTSAANSHTHRSPRDNSSSMSNRPGCASALNTCACPLNRALDGRVAIDGSNLANALILSTLFFAVCRPLRPNPVPCRTPSSVWLQASGRGAKRGRERQAQGSRERTVASRGADGSGGDCRAPKVRRQAASSASPATGTMLRNRSGHYATGRAGASVMTRCTPSGWERLVDNEQCQRGGSKGGRS